MDNRNALDPRHSVVVEACAGSGKTWLLVSRIVRLLLDGVQPGEILAITFTRKAAQEMQERLRDWLYELASADDEQVREFLRQRAVAEADIDGCCARTQPVPAVPAGAAGHHDQQRSTAGSCRYCNARRSRGHGGRGATGRADRRTVAGSVADLPGRSALAPDSETAQAMLALFEEHGLSNTQKMLRAFADKRSEWWAYTAGHEDALAYALDSLRAELDVDMDSDPVAGLLARAASLPIFARSRHS